MESCTRQVERLPDIRNWCCPNQYRPEAADQIVISEIHQFHRYEDDFVDLGKGRFCSINLEDLVVLDSQGMHVVVIRQDASADTFVFGLGDFLDNSRSLRSGPQRLTSAMR